MNLLIYNTRSRIGFIGLIGLMAVFALFAFSAKTVSASGLIKPSNNLGLLAYYSFEDATGTQATDFSGRGNSGALINSSVWVGGKFGKGLQFDGVNQKVRVTDPPLDVGLGSLSVSAWIKTSSALEQGIVTKRANSLNSESGYGMKIMNTTFLNVYFGDGVKSGSNSASTPALNDDRWHHIVMVIDRNSNLLKGYVDSIERISTSIASASSSQDNSQDLRIGSRNDNSNYFNGSIDEVRIYNRALSGTEVTALYSSSGIAKTNSSLNNFMTSGLVGLWSFDGADLRNTTAYDRSGQGKNGFLTGGPTTVRGKVGQALSFDGSNDYIDLPVNIVSSNVLSVSLWTKLDQVDVFQNLFSIYTTDTDCMEIAVLNTGSRLFGGNWDNRAVSDYGAISIGKWHHVVLTSDGSLTKLFVDGVLSGTTGTTNFSTFSAEGAIGARTNGGAGGFFSDAIVDDVRVYNRVLSADEVKKLYQAGTATVNKSTSGISSGLVAWHTFDGNKLTTTTSTDSTGLGIARDGVVSGGPRPIRGKVGQALDFDGVDDYIGLNSGAWTDDIETQGGGGLSVGAWVYPRGYGEFSEGIVVTKGGAATTSNGVWRFGVVGNNGRFLFEKSYDTTVLSRTTSDNTFLLNRWQHIVATWDGSATATNIHIYFNGIEASYVTTTNGVGNKVSDAANNLFINNTSRDLNGLMDDVRIYNRVLSAAEVLQLYNNTK